MRVSRAAMFASMTVINQAWVSWCNLKENELAIYKVGGLSDFIFFKWQKLKSAKTPL